MLPGDNSRIGSASRLLRVGLLAGCVLLPGAALALDANAGNGNAGNGANPSSMDDVARMIRRNSQWEILDARSRQKGDETRYRFKLINNTGKVKVISVDPRKPNLRKLEQ